MSAGGVPPSPAPPVHNFHFLTFCFSVCVEASADIDFNPIYSQTIQCIYTDQKKKEKKKQLKIDLTQMIKLCLYRSIERQYMYNNNYQNLRLYNCNKTRRLKHKKNEQIRNVTKCEQNRCGKYRKKSKNKQPNHRTNAVSNWNMRNYLLMLLIVCKTFLSRMNEGEKNTHTNSHSNINFLVNLKKKKNEIKEKTQMSMLPTLIVCQNIPPASLHYNANSQCDVHGTSRCGTLWTYAKQLRVFFFLSFIFK